jgi:hypothetical protein
METIKIILFAILAAIIYGICHDLITAHICVEYFSEFHPRIIRTESPVVLALLWGVLATWWVGLILGIVLAIAARSGRRAKRSASSLRRPIVVLMFVSGIIAILIGLSGHLLAINRFYVLRGPAFDKHSDEWIERFQTVLFAHNGSYAAGFIGGIILAVMVFRNRRTIADGSDSTIAAQSMVSSNA